jgi:hypothetical protein
MMYVIGPIGKSAGKPIAGRNTSIRDRINPKNLFIFSSFLRFTTKYREHREI